MIEPKNSKISVSRQCELLGIPRSTHYYRPRRKEKGSRELLLENRIHDHWMTAPFYGYRKLAEDLKRCGIKTTEAEVRGIMRRMGIKAIPSRPNLSRPAKSHKKYPYLLRGVEVVRRNQVWSSDITYIRLKGAFVYLTAVIDWFSRKVLSWRLSNSLDASFCVDALKEAIALYGKPEVFNTDQGSQFTSEEFTGVLEKAKIQISMDGKGRALDNVYVERLWRSIKYENIHLNDYQTVPELRDGVEAYFRFYNSRRVHQALGYAVPDDVYYGHSQWSMTA